MTALCFFLFFVAPLIICSAMILKSMGVSALIGFVLTIIVIFAFIAGIIKWLAPNYAEKMVVRFFETLLDE